MFLYKITVASGRVLRVVISVFEEVGVWEEGVGTHHKNHLNVLSFSQTETDI